MNKFYQVLIAIMFITICAQSFNIKSRDAQINKLTIENFTLDDKLKAQIKITNGNVRIVYKEKEKIVEKKIYIPPESKDVSITTDKDDKIEVHYNRYGITFTPFIGLSYSTTFCPEIGARLAYFDRWGTGLSASLHNVRLFIDYRIDWELMKNSSIGIYTANDKEIGIVVHTFL